MNTFSIKDLENLSGIKAHTIRIWEQRYSFLKPLRTNTNIRCYNNDELKIILNIALLIKSGHRISLVDRMSAMEIQDRIFNLTNGDAQQEQVVRDLILSMLALDLHLFEKTIDDHIRKHGIEATIHRIIFPFLERIGVLWVTDRITAAHEHLVSNIIRQKLIVGIENLSRRIQLKSSVLLFLPAGEYHEMGLLYLSFLLKSRGIRTLYLGCSVPIDDLQYLVDLKKPDFLFTHLTCVSDNFNFERFLEQVTQKIRNTTFIVSGKLVNNYRKKVPARVVFKHTLPDLTRFISAIK